MIYELTSNGFVATNPKGASPPVTPESEDEAIDQG